MSTPQITYPLRVRTDVQWRFRIFAAAFVVLGALLAASFTSKTRLDVRQLLEERRIWAQGLPARDVSVAGKVSTTRFVSHKYDLTVGYTDKEGKRQVARLTFETLGATLDESVIPEVRYDATHPSQCALNTALAVRWGRIASIVFLFLFGAGGMGIGFVALGLYFGSLLRTYAHCGTRSDVIAVAITRIIRVERHGEHRQTRYKYKYVSPSGQRISGEVTFPVHCEPIYADESRQHMIALLSAFAPRRPVVLRNDFHPFTEPKKSKDAK
jgi:hypothetical protein